MAQDPPATRMKGTGQQVVGVVSGYWLLDSGDWVLTGLPRRIQVSGYGIFVWNQVCPETTMWGRGALYVGGDIYMEGMLCTYFRVTREGSLIYSTSAPWNPPS